MPVKAFGAAELRQGRIPAFNPSWGLGQPFRGEPQRAAVLPREPALSRAPLLERLQPPLRPALAARRARHGRPRPRSRAEPGGGAGRRPHLRRFGVDPDDLELLQPARRLRLVAVRAPRRGARRPEGSCPRRDRLRDGSAGRGAGDGCFGDRSAVTGGPPAAWAAPGRADLLRNRDHRAADRPPATRGDRAYPRLHLAGSPRRRGRRGRPVPSRAGAAARADRPFPVRPPLGPRQRGVLAVGRAAGAAVHPHPASGDRRPLARSGRSAAGAGVGAAGARRAGPRLGRRVRRRRPGVAIPRAGALSREAPLLVRARRLPARRLGARTGARSAPGLAGGHSRCRRRAVPRGRRLPAGIADRRLAGGGAGRSGVRGRGAADAGGVVDPRAGPGGGAPRARRPGRPPPERRRAGRGAARRPAAARRDW